MKVTRPGGVTTVMRRCCEFRELAQELKDDLPQFIYPDLPDKKLAFGLKQLYRYEGHPVDPKERSKRLQLFLDYLLAMKIYTARIHRFLAPNHEVPFYLKKFKHKAADKAPPIVAVPNPSLIVGPEGRANPSFAEGVVLNMESLKQNTVQIGEPELIQEPIQGPPIEGSKLEPAPTSTATAEDNYTQSVLNRATEMKKLEGSLREEMASTVHLKDIKLQSKKTYYSIVVSCDLVGGESVTKTTNDDLKGLHSEVT